MKKSKKLICIFLVLAMAFSSIAASKAQKTYDKAQDELVDGNYGKAAKLFESIANYEDSSVLAMYCKAAALGEEGKYKEAVSAFEMIEEFKDSEYMKKYYEICSYAFADDATWEDKLDASDEFDEMMLFRDSSKKADECRESAYQMAMNLKKNGRYEEAIEAFYDLDTYYNYKDSKEQIQNCETAILEREYQSALELYKAGEYEEAEFAFWMLGDYKDSEERIQSCISAIQERDYQVALELYNTGDYEAAISAFSKLGDYKDSKEQIQNCETAIQERSYQEACVLRDSGKYEEAIVAFKAIEDYKDSKEQINNCENAILEREYQKACDLNKSGKYAEAYAIFSTLTGYKDVDDIIKNDKNIAAVVARISQFPVGKTVTFGAYEQDNNKSNGKETIEWQVLANDGKKALLISKYALDAKEYNEDWEAVTWEECTLRAWLNGDFYNTAFSTAEQNQIITTNVSADKNPEYSRNPGKATQDKIFLLSITEAEKYFTTDEARKCAPTTYAKANGAWTSSSKKTADGAASCWWWLRSPGNRQSNAADVDSDGSISYGGTVSLGDDCVRPALWINLDS